MWGRKAFAVRSKTMSSPFGRTEKHESYLTVLASGDSIGPANAAKSYIPMMLEAAACIDDVSSS